MAVNPARSGRKQR